LHIDRKLRKRVTPGMSARDLEKLLKEILDSVPVASMRRVAD
jgi:hypothetical protein